MATTSNAFDLLVGADNRIASANKKKNKPKNKTNKAKEDFGNDIVAELDVTQHVTAHGPAANGNAAKQPAAVPKTAPALNAVVDVAEASAIFERAAREAKTIGDKAKLWKDWVRQATDKSGKGLKYRDIDGTTLDFRQALLRSKALEISMESLLISGLSPEKEDALVQLLSVFTSSSSYGPSLPHDLASALFRLSSLLADEAPDTIGAAQRAVHNVIAALKCGADAGEQGDGGAPQLSSWLSRLAKLDKEISRSQAALQSLLAAGNGAATKEHTNVAKQIYKLYEEKFDLLQGENIPSVKANSAAADASVRTLTELKTVIANHLKDASAVEESAKGKGASGDAQKQQNMAAYKREEAILAQQAADVAAQIRTLEAQLRSLRSQQAEIDEKRAQIQQRQRLALESLGAKAGRAQGVLSLAHYRDELSVVEGLQGLVDPSSQPGAASPQQSRDIQASQASAPIDYVFNAQSFLNMACASLADIPSRINFCKQRVAQAEKIMSLARGPQADKDKHMKQLRDAESLLADTLKYADDIFRSCMQAVSEVNRRYDAIVRSSPDQGAAAAEVLRVMDTLTAQIRAQYESIQSANRGLNAAPAAPVPAQQQAQQATRPMSGAAPAAPVPAAAPAPAAAAAPPPPPPAAHAAPASRPVTAPVAPAPAAAPSAAAPAPVAAPQPRKPDSNGTAAHAARPAAPEPVVNQAPAAPPRQWAKPAGNAAAAAASEDASLPTPAEALAKAAEDGFKQVNVKKNRKKA